MRNKILTVGLCPPTLWTLRTLSLRTPCPPTKSQVPLKMLVVMEVHQQRVKYLMVCGSWKASSHFTPPGPAVGFDESVWSAKPLATSLRVRVLQAVSDRGAGGRHSGGDLSLCLGSTGKERASGKVDPLTGERKIKPGCVLDYNRQVGGYGGHDKQLCGRRSGKHQVV